MPADGLIPLYLLYESSTIKRSYTGDMNTEHIVSDIIKLTSKQVSKETNKRAQS